MNRKLLVTLLRKDIQELEMITEGFMEMNEFPAVIITLAQRKAEDIQSYIQQLSSLKSEILNVATIEISEPSTAEIHMDDSPSIPSWIEPVAQETLQAEIPEEIINRTVATPEVSEKIILNQENTITNTTKQTIELVEVSKTTQTISHEQNIQTTFDETRKRVLGDKTSSTSQSRNELLSKTDHSISSTLAHKKITDIRQAINIGDRFRFQRELFHGNGEDMNKTLAYLNQLATEEEALSFIETKYSWTPENETAEDFRQIVRRRFL